MILIIANSENEYEEQKVISIIAKSESDTAKSDYDTAKVIMILQKVKWFEQKVIRQKVIMIRPESDTAKSDYSKKWKWNEYAKSDYDLLHSLSIHFH